MIASPLDCIPNLETSPQPQRVRKPTDTRKESSRRGLSPTPPRLATGSLLVVEKIELYDTQPPLGGHVATRTFTAGPHGSARRGRCFCRRQNSPARPTTAECIYDYCGGINQPNAETSRALPPAVKDGRQSWLLLSDKNRRKARWHTHALSKDSSNPAQACMLSLQEL